MVTILRPPLQARGPLLNLYQPKAGDGCALWLPGQNDAYSATIRDRSGYGNHGAITGASWTRLSSGLLAQYFVTDDWINCGNGASTQLQIFTALCWAKPETMNGANLFSHAQESASGWALTFASSTRITFDDNYVAFPVDLDPSPINPFDGVWRLWGISRDAGNNCTIWADGVALKTSSYAGVFGFGNMQIGRRSQAEASYYKGWLWGMHLSSSALSAAVQLGIYQQERHLFGV